MGETKPCQKETRRWLSHQQMHVHRFRERTQHGNEIEKRNEEHEHIESMKT